MTTVIVAGATGVFGKHIVRQLTSAGHQVLGLGRAEGNQIRADLLDREGLLRAFDGVRADVVVHAATALKKPPTSHKLMYGTDDLRVQGTRNLIDAAQRAGVTRFIGENIVFGYGYRDFGKHVITEADPFGVPEAHKEFNRHIDAMLQKEKLPIAAGLESISLRYGLFYGPGATETMAELIRKRQFPAFNDHGHVLPWINLVDAAGAVVAALERGRPGEAYNIVDESAIGFGGMTREVAKAYRLSKPMTVPTWVTVVMPYLHRMTEMDMRVSTDKARRELGWEPVYRTVAEGLAAQAR
jgi:nucleoside-diphosphate-sugar epimerase